MRFGIEVVMTSHEDNSIVAGSPGWDVEALFHSVNAALEIHGACAPEADVIAENIRVLLDHWRRLRGSTGAAE